MGFARNADGIALILIAESIKQVIKSVIHLGNPGLFLSEKMVENCTRKIVIGYDQKKN
jgi:hypothetical protein